MNLELAIIVYVVGGCHCLEQNQDINPLVSQVSNDLHNCSTST